MLLHSEWHWARTAAISATPKPRLCSMEPLALLRATAAASGLAAAAKHRAASRKHRAARAGSRIPR